MRLGAVRHHAAGVGRGELAQALGADYNAKETARRLYVHPNTLTYCLRAIRRLLGGDPARGDLRLTVELALKLKDLPRLSAGSGADAR